MIRKAFIHDIKPAHKLISDFANKQLMLARPLNELYENLRDYFVCVDGETLIGVCALHVMWENMSEIKSLAVAEDSQKKGIGRQLVENCINEAKALGVQRIMVLTYVPEFFVKMGFTKIDKTTLPQKTWGECLHCPKFPDCDEQALLIEL